MVIISLRSVLRKFDSKRCIVCLFCFVQEGKKVFSKLTFYQLSLQSLVYICA